MFRIIISVVLLMTLIGTPKQISAQQSSGVDECTSDYERSLLVFSRTEGWRHESIEPGVEAVERMGSVKGFHVYATENADYFTDENLSKYDAVLFLNTSETVFEEQHRQAFESFINAGGGYAGTHSAADTEYDWPWYGQLVGAWFDSHPPVQTARIRVTKSDHPSTESLPDPWEKEDEWYNFQSLPAHVNVLLELDTESFEGSEHEGYHPIAWSHEFDGGKAFYTGLGHTVESWSDPLFLEHLWGGIRYVTGWRR